MMKPYMGMKIIQAEPMDLDTYNALYNKVIPADKHLSKEGYRVQYPDGYISWSPKSEFEKAYREITDEEKAMVI